MLTQTQSRLTTWWVILRICLEERLVYRGDFWLGTLVRFLPIVTQIFLWGAIFEGFEDKGNDEPIAIAGYSYHDFVAYYLLTMISRSFSSMPGLASGIALQIRDGEIKKFLVQPVDFIGFTLLSRIAHKLVYYGVAIGPFTLVFFLCRKYFRDGWLSTDVMAAYVTSLILAFLLGFFLEASIGMIGFWWLEVSSLLFIYMLFSFFFSGHMFPLDMLPKPWSSLMQIIPLQYLTYFPAAIFLGKVQGAAMWQGLAIQAGGVLFFIVFSRIGFYRGVNRYSGYGG